MCRRFFTVVCCLIAVSLSALASRQNDAVLKGKVVDNVSGEPVGWTTVSLAAADSTIVAGCACSEDGTFELKAPAGKYRFAANLIGYKEYTASVSMEVGVNDIGTISLEEDAQMLQGAVTTARQNLIEMKIDKVVMNVSQSSFAHGSNALDLIKKAPGVTVDKDGNVQLNGKNVSVWIDGRPSYVSGKTLEALLRSTDSDSIERFELMEHPSAKYDAEGRGGIINIKTKRNQLQGFNGNLSIGGGGMYFKDVDQFPLQSSVSANLSYRTAKTNTFLNLSEENYGMPIKTINDFAMPATKFTQSSTSLLNTHALDLNFKFGTDWFIDDKNTLGVIANIPIEKSSVNTKESSARMYSDGILTQQTRSGINNGPNKIFGQNVNLNYTHVFDPARSSEITFNLDYYHNASKENNNEVDTTIVAAHPDPMLFSYKRMEADNRYDIYSVKADYQGVVFKKFMLETGVKWALSKTDNNSLESFSGVPDQHTFFQYNEHIAAAYVSIAGQLSPKLSFKAGLRGEYTNSFGDWKSSGTQTRRDYFNLFPTVYLGYAPTEKWRLSMAYSRRINRPRYEQLNPTKTFMDSKSYLLGNPDILPQIGGTLSLGAGYGNHLSGALAYQYAKNVVNQNPSYDADGNQYYTWGNFGKQRVYVASFNVSSLPVSKWLQWTLSANGMYLKSIEGASGMIRDCFTFQGYTALSFLLPKNWKIDFDAKLGTPMVFGYFETNLHFSSNIAVKKSLLDDRLILTLKLDDIFRSDNGNLNVRYADGSTVALKQLWSMQALTFNVSWSFGKAQKPVKQRRVGDLEEMSRVGKSGGIGN